MNRGAKKSPAAFATGLFQVTTVGRCQSALCIVDVRELLLAVVRIFAILEVQVGRRAPFRSFATIVPLIVMMTCHSIGHMMLGVMAVESACGHGRCRDGNQSESNYRGGFHRLLLS